MDAKEQLKEQYYIEQGKLASRFFLFVAVLLFLFYIFKDKIIIIVSYNVNYYNLADIIISKFRYFGIGSLIIALIFRILTSIRIRKLDDKLIQEKD